MIEYINGVFGLHTDGISCLLRVNEYGLIELLHFGQSVKTRDADAFICRQGMGWGSSILLNDADTGSCPDAMPLAWSGSGRGDYRESPLSLGGVSTDLRYESHEIIDGTAPMSCSLPQAKGNAETLIITLAQQGIRARLYFSVFKDAITRRTEIINLGNEPIMLTKLMSHCTDLFGDLEMTTFDGGWIAEARRHTAPVQDSRTVNESSTGFSSNRHNPGFLIHEVGATEDFGRVWGFNLIYSGNHYAAAQRSLQGITRIVQGISPNELLRPIAPGESFESPEAVISFSDEGFAGLSKRMHAFVNTCIIPKYWQNRPRPVLFNDWEGCMFDFDERKLLSLARSAKKLGCELFVLDDGWFGKRNDDKASLGDYAVNREKLPSGLEGLGKKINKMGMQFGLWFEPESVNPDSDLFRAHPEWALTDGFEPLLGRHQLLLDLTLPQVQDYIVEQVTRVLDSAPISYVKWDMNRHSIALGSRAHEYILGFYKVLDRIFTPRPEILLENCASGGNRFDLGVLCFGPQTWCSDDTDAAERMSIQENLSYLYPQSTFGAHVSATPNAQTLRSVPLSTRGNVSFFGCLGYELDLKHLIRLEREEIREQIEFYKRYRSVFQFGALRRHSLGWQVSDGGVTLAVAFRKLQSAAPPYRTLRLKAMNPSATYRLATRAQKLRIGQFGALVKHVAPVDLNPNGLILRAADRLITIPDGAQELTASGAALMAGVRLLPGFRGTGYDTNQYTITDFGSELYVIEEESTNEES